MPDITPLYLVTLPSGDVQAVFPGGVQILAGDTVSPPDERKVTWVRQSDGALVASVDAYSIGSNDQATWRLFDPDNPTNRNANLIQKLDAASGRATVTAHAQTVGNAATRTIVDDLGQSSFIQSGGGVGKNIDLWGGVTAAGGILNAGSGQWSVVRTALGTYTLTFTTPFSSPPTVLVNALQALGFPSADPGVGGVIVFVENGGATAFVDSDWWFIARGLG